MTEPDWANHRAQEILAHLRKCDLKSEELALLALHLRIVEEQGVSRGIAQVRKVISS